MLISVVIPMYNAERTIKSTLISVVDQTVTPYEIIVINDGSTDGCREIVEDFIQKESQFNIILVNKPNGGVSSARNVGLKMAKGGWIALLDSDDVWLPNKLDEQMSTIKQNSGIDFLGTTRNGEIIKNILWKRLDLLTRITPKNLLVRFVFVTPTIIFKRVIIDDIGYFDENQKYAEEGNYFIRIAQKYNCFLLNKSLVVTGGGKAHFGESGLSGNIWEMEKGELKNINMAFNIGIINYVEKALLTGFSLLKYFRRVLIVKMRKL